MLIHFILPGQYATMLGHLSRMHVGVDYPYWLGGRFNWIAQSWLVLREYMHGITVGTAPVAGAVNVAHVMTWRALGRRQGEFRVSIRADYPRLFDVDFEILQNPGVGATANRLYLPYWPVPGLIPRDSTRTGVRTIAYAGRIGPLNLAEDFRSTGAGLLSAFDFRVIPPEGWHDLAGIDVLVAIRTFDRKTHDNKPPSKLFSAWHAGIPLIGGWDSAFSSIAEPGREYLRVESQQEFAEALDALANEPRRYADIVDAGRRRAGEFTHDRMARQWQAAFAGPIRAAHARWRASGPTLQAAVIGSAVDRLRDVASMAKASIGRAVKAR